MSQFLTVLSMYLLQWNSVLTFSYRYTYTILSVDAGYHTAISNTGWSAYPVQCAIVSHYSIVANTNVNSSIISFLSGGQKVWRGLLCHSRATNFKAWNTFFSHVPEKEAGSVWTGNTMKPHPWPSKWGPTLWECLAEEAVNQHSVV